MLQAFLTATRTGIFACRLDGYRALFLKQNLFGSRHCTLWALSNSALLQGCETGLEVELAYICQDPLCMPEACDLSRHVTGGNLILLGAVPRRGEKATSRVHLLLADRSGLTRYLDNERTTPGLPEWR